MPTHYQHEILPDGFISTLYRKDVYQGVGDGGTLVLDEEYCFDNHNPDNGGCRHRAVDRGLRTAVVQWNDQTGEHYLTKAEYDSYGNQTRIVDPNNHDIQTAYDSTYHVHPSTVTNALSQITQTYWDPALGVPLWRLDPNNVYTDIVKYDPVGRIKGKTTADGGVTTIEYNNLGTPSQDVTSRMVDGTQDGLWTKVVFDGLGRTTQIVKKGDGVNAAAYQAEISYGDSSKSPWTTTHWHNPNVATYTETSSYDYLGRIIDVAHPDLSRTSVLYSVGQRTDTDERGDTKISHFDSFERLSSVDEIFADQNGPTTKTALYRYDALGRLRQTEDTKGNLSTTLWDSLGRKVQTADLDMGTWNFTYDGVGNLLNQIDARGITISFSYDALNRRQAKTNSSNNHSVSWHYDESAAHSNSIGRLTSVTDSADTICPTTADWSYDPMGRVVTETHCVDGISKTINSQFDPFGRLSMLQYPLGDVVHQNYDAAGRIHDVDGYVNEMTYDAAAKLLHTSLANGVTEQFDYAPEREWLQNVTMTLPNGVNAYIAQYTYYSDGLVNTRHQVTSGIGTSIAGGGMSLQSEDSVAYSYDQLHRLLTVSGDLSESFTYDPIGNMLTGSGLGARTYGPGWQACGTSMCGGGPHAMLQAGGRSYLYDQNGNMLSGSVGDNSPLQRVFAWDEQSRLSAVGFSTTTGGVSGLVSMTYDADGERVKKVGADGGITRYFGKYAELTPTGDLVQYYYAGNRLVGKRVGVGAKTFYHQDRLGSTRFLSDNAGNPLTDSNFLYASYGGLSRGQASLANNIVFTGQRQDADTAGSDSGEGLVYLHARYYDPLIGRFISADSVIPDLANPQALNRYSYIFNNPIFAIDPTGHGPEDSWLSRVLDAFAHPFGKDTDPPNVRPLDEQARIGQGGPGRRVLDKSAIDDDFTPKWTHSPNGKPLDWDTQSFIGVTDILVTLLTYGVGTPAPANLVELEPESTVQTAASSKVANPAPANTFEAPAGGPGAAEQGPPRVLQSTGNTIKPATARALGLTEGEATDVMHAMKRGEGIDPKMVGKIMSNGDYVHPHTGEVLGNLYDYVP